MGQAEAAVLAAAIGGIAAVLGALVLGFVAVGNETRRRRWERADNERRALRAQAALVFEQVFVLQHEMEWLTWHAHRRPAAVRSELTEAYEDAVHRAYPRLLGAMAVLASLDLKLYNLLLPLTEQLFALESDIGTEITRLGLPDHAGEALAALQGMHSTVSALYRTYPPRLAEVLQTADATYIPTRRW